MSYKTMQRCLDNALYDLRVLSGEIVGPSDSTWQDVAGTAAVNLRVLANLLDESRTRGGPFTVFPEVRTDLEICDICGGLEPEEHDCATKPDHIKRPSNPYIMGEAR